MFLSFAPFFNEMCAVSFVSPGPLASADSGSLQPTGHTHGDPPQRLSVLGEVRGACVSRPPGVGTKDSKKTRRGYAWVRQREGMCRKEHRTETTTKLLLGQEKCYESVKCICHVKSSKTICKTGQSSLQSASWPRFHRRGMSP